MELFSTESKKIVTDPLNVNNPISLQVLGICSALAVTIRAVCLLYTSPSPRD